MHRIDPDRFLTAQPDVYDNALQEIRLGKKRTHWMWFVFPQGTGLDSSAMSARYAIGSLAETQAYRAHHLLGRRLRELTETMNAAYGKDPVSILGSVDAMKFHSSMTLFYSVTVGPNCFLKALDKFFGGRHDEATVRQIAISQKAADS